jgi:hypothetical protein
MSGFLPAALHAALIMRPYGGPDVERHMGATGLNVNEDQSGPDGLPVIHIPLWIVPISEFRRKSQVGRLSFRERSDKEAGRSR